MTQAERFQALVEGQHSEVTNQYKAAFHLLSQTQELYDKSKEYATSGIEFSNIVEALEEEYEDRVTSRLITLVHIAESLFRYHSEHPVMPHHVAKLPLHYRLWVWEAINIAADGKI